MHLRYLFEVAFHFAVLRHGSVESVFGNEGVMMKKRIELIQPIQRRVFGAIEQYAKAGGYDLVLDKASNASMLYHSDSVNHTENIIELLK
jgi:outer membrane protein